VQRHCETAPFAILTCHPQNRLVFKDRMWYRYHIKQKRKAITGTLNIQRFGVVSLPYEAKR
jgi:hypothetical protein